MSLLDENDNGIVDADKVGKVLLYADDYDQTPARGSGCSCLSLVLVFFGAVLTLFILGMLFGR